MKEFITLEEFLLYRDPIDKYKRTIHRVVMAAEEWPKYYQQAKESWEKYGDVGPPIGSIVKFIPDRGGRFKLAGVFERDPRFFQLYDHPMRKDSWALGSIIQIDHWWAMFKVVA